ncbi:RelE toxin of RelE / RelB toxin-antitoxin system [Prevotella sp. ne3005]|uniref:type II toxin-antitoxin system RelE/ParE family toxin n=1 Tax=Prevotella sp. ne3005 TaxID=1761887 RepID=UPI0008AFF6FC|nr:type II toxin-antitoxin system RelE/ParE family toxin [Prevotella sp. ne3005]SEM94637.1 RelE toxin of RelE / RelB toxin-antitoxin system [Prevotella sp. ne3005]
MNCKIEATPDFARELKQLAKRYPSMKDDYRHFIDTLRNSPLTGKPLGKHLRKVRFPITSKAKGKSGGARVITHTVLVESDGADITLVTIYDKSDQANITDKELKQLIKKNGLE